MAGLTRRKFTEEFKLEAVRLASMGERSAKEVASDLGIGESVLHRWKKEFRDRTANGLSGGLSNGKVTGKVLPGSIFPGHGKLTPQDEELRQLRQENAILRQERDILKKATAYFAKESR